jgi:phosphoglycolate phosphatase-like HAD superfamily hydrolase
MHGRTDPVIFRDCFHATQLSGDWLEAYTRFTPQYLRELPTCIEDSTKKRILPGVPELLQELAARPAQVALALGTGNMERGARLKIEHFGLNPFFPVGGFGDHHEIRAEIMRDAVANSESHYQHHFQPRDSWVIGDTIHDVEGGKAIGARTLGVATGGAFSVNELRAAGADFVCDDLSDLRYVMSAFGL